MPASPQCGLLARVEMVRLVLGKRFDDEDGRIGQVLDPMHPPVGRSTTVVTPCQHLAVIAVLRDTCGQPYSDGLTKHARVNAAALAAIVGEEHPDHAAVARLDRKPHGPSKRQRQEHDSLVTTTWLRESAIGEVSTIRRSEHYPRSIVLT